MKSDVIGKIIGEVIATFSMKSLATKRKKSASFDVASSLIRNSARGSQKTRFFCPEWRCTRSAETHLFLEAAPANTEVRLEGGPYRIICQFLD